MWIEYVALGPWFLQDPHRAKRWRKKVFERLAWVSRYGHVSPSEAIGWELSDLNDYMQALHEILKDENKPPKGRRGR